MIKKLLGIVVLGLLLSGNAYAKEMKLICEHTKGEFPKVLVMNDNKRSLKVEDVPGVNLPLNIQNYSNDQIEGNREIMLNGKIEQRMLYNLDRRTGILTLRSMFADGDVYFHNYNCELLKENKF
jgi:hypothetical protein